MRYLISYDLADDRRRDRLATHLLNYGPRLQESLFLADVTEVRFADLRKGMEEIVDPLMDSVLLVPVCDGCWKKVEVKGLAVLPGPQSFYII